ncbi:hypothetical protein BBH99_15410 [Chryseobacterium contaminans]|uniref:Uncharacterized protein n=1 Tax=Chryseobacterium contaminans TaxID=1423959 RepID=A0A1M6Y5K6_9FLAO|nr:hypothetical protein [Chryseobacterium contaminans]OCA80454.1 hypothetical protein BBH99_15410 [Chryseobacterium contaminans]SHL13536.1 hypothetical protein SAMN05444407_102364 [Chryseobacterium contaminans]
MEFYQHYSEFLGKHNIYKTLTTIKRYIYIEAIILILLLILVGIGMYFFVKDTITNNIPLSEAYFEWPFILMISSLAGLYIYMAIDRRRQFIDIKKRVGYFKQNMVGVILFGINWDSIVLKYHWFDSLYNNYIFLNNKELEFFKSQNDKELAIKTIPKFPFNLSSLISISSPIISTLSFILLTFGITGKEQNVMIILILLLISPIFFAVIMFIRDNFNEKKSDYKNMQNYSSVLDYILEKRKMNSSLQNEELIAS